MKETLRERIERELRALTVRRDLLKDRIADYANQRRFSDAAECQVKMDMLTHIITRIELTLIDN